MPILPGFRCDVDDVALLRTLAVAPLPLGLAEHATRRALHRDLYLDTADRALLRRGVTCHIRFGADDRRWLGLTIEHPGEPGSAPAAEYYEAETSAVEAREALAGASEPARRLRGLADPAALRPWMELEVDSTQRYADGGWLRRGKYLVSYDEVVVRSDGLVRAFQQVDVRRLRRGRPPLDAIADALERGYGIRPSRQTMAERAAFLARLLREDARLRSLGLGRAIALIALDDDAIALRADGGARRLPIVDGSGEEAGRLALQESLGSRVGELVLLGTAPATAERGDLEVWLARRVRRDTGAGASGIVWVPLRALARAAGSETLRDPDSRAALAVAAESTLLPEWSTNGIEPELKGAAGAVPRAPGRARRRHRTHPTRAAAELAPHERLDPALSLLAFHERVLSLAEDDATPLLERLRYLGIVSANLDEFHMVTIGDLGPPTADLEHTARRTAVTGRVRSLLARQRACLDACLPLLAARGVRLLAWSDLDEAQRGALRTRFRREIFPLLTPRAITVDPGHPFPVIPHLALSLAVVMQDGETGPAHFVYLRLPRNAPRFLEVPGAGLGLLPLEELVRARLGDLYPDRLVERAALFRITRRGALGLREPDAGNLLQAIEEDVLRRRTSPVVRIEVERAMPPRVREMLLRELRFESGHPSGSLGPVEMHEVDGLMALGDLRQLASLPLEDALFPAFSGRAPDWTAAPIWDAIRAADRLVHHPYDDFGVTVQRLFETAADDPDVVAIKTTLYRVGESSPVVAALLRAAEHGKEVTAFIELKARFDEATNAAWVRRLERAGVAVVYGLVGFKNHAKVTLVLRREPDGIRRYVHVGTGNYNAATARLYTDLGLFTADDAIAEDLTDLFNGLTGSTHPPVAPLRRLLAAPGRLLPALAERIEREARHAREGRGGRIRAKLNGLEEPEVIRALYDASRAGVDIELSVRGLCTLRPGVPDLSERIRVQSVVGRFLEHGRIYHFANAGEDEYFIGSADWRSRNLRRRVEVVAPITDPACRRRLDTLLTEELADPSAWELLPDGSYRQRERVPCGDPRTLQGARMAEARSGG